MIDARARFGNLLHDWKQKLACKSEQCDSLAQPWKRISRNAGSILLHDARYCFPACFERELLREIDFLHAASSTSLHTSLRRIPLGLLMLSRGDLSQIQLQEALESQRRHRSGRIGEWIQKLGFADEKRVTAALAAQSGCPVLHDVPKRAIDDVGVPFILLKRFNMVPVHHVRSTRTLYIAFAGSVEYRALLAVERLLQCRTQPCLIDGSVLQSLLLEIEEQPNRSDALFESVGDRTEIVRICSSFAEKTGATSARVTACGEHLWFRLSDLKSAVNLVFPRTVGMAEPVKKTRQVRIV